MRGQRKPLGPERTGHAPEKQYSEFRAAENTQLQSELFKALQSVWMWHLLCVCVSKCGGQKVWLGESAAILEAAQSSSVRRRPSVSRRTPGFSSSSPPPWTCRPLFSRPQLRPRPAHHRLPEAPLNPHWSSWFQAQASFYHGRAVVINAPHCGRLTFPLIMPVIYSCAFFQGACCANLPKRRFCALPLGAHG